MQTIIAGQSIKDKPYAICKDNPLTTGDWRSNGCPWRCACAYAEGLVKPNYPVPAIRYRTKLVRSRYGVRLFTVWPKSKSIELIAGNLRGKPVWFERLAYQPIGWNALRYWL